MTNKQYCQSCILLVLYIILKWIFKTDCESVVDSSSSEHGQEVGCFEYGDESSGFVNCGEFIE